MYYVYSIILFFVVKVSLEFCHDPAFHLLSVQNAIGSENKSKQIKEFLKVSR